MNTLSPVPTALLIINKKGEFLDKVSLVDNAKGTVEHMFEYISGNLTPVTFEVYAAEDIKAADGIAPDYYKKDDLIGTITTDDTGIAKLGDLPVGKYYVQEKETAHGYVNAGEKKEFTFTYEGSDKDLLSYSFTFVNEPTTVEVSKTDITNSKELPGTKLTIFDRDGKEVESWVSEEKPHYIEKLPAGEYTLREVTAPDGYEVAEDVKFKVEETGEIQHVVMKDSPKKQPETTPTTEKPTTPNNPTNPTTPSTETPKKDSPTTPKTGDDRNPLIWLLLFGIGGCMAGAAWYLRKKGEKDQNQD